MVETHRCMFNIQFDFLSKLATFIYVLLEKSTAYLIVNTLQRRRKDRNVSKYNAL